MAEREAFLAFLLSMMTQVDELTKARHYQMSYYEFLEGLARIAEKASLIPFISNQPQVQLPLEERRLQPLHYKLEGLLLHIYYRLGKTIKRTLSDLDS
jgi:hypothetical protein